MRRLFAWGLILLLASAFVPRQSAWASVVMQGTRVVVVEGTREKSIQFSNPSDHPFLVQVWASRTPGATEDTGLPFVVAPPVFKLEPRSGQTVRLKILPDPELADIERVYYLNFSHIPAIKAQAEEANRLILLIKSTVKIFYRPAALHEGAFDIGKRLEYRLTQEQLEIRNPTPFNVNINSIRVEADEGIAPVDMQPQMLAPRATARWGFRSAMHARDKARISISTVNDYGAEVTESIDTVVK
ncbi:fimbrial biogenesis chaperone [Diaphorobacter aerolatus]|uniref:Molecular chaperone n=1 Tax=Diaphorobacter aerolatus TaxID=1288495 RepID=A0A7H0GMF0_9BURK|nr:molecular chaperone [Diaphorobacter aerolatus]QNP49466.1 molecular chaperone [Diaphorobacter aerolatus]